MKVKKKASKKKPVKKKVKRSPTTGQFLAHSPHLWKPGEVVNTGLGKPKTLTGTYKQLLREKHPLLGIPWMEVIARTLIEKAAGGNLQAAIELRQATEGTKALVGLNWKEEAEAFGIDPQALMRNFVELAKKELSNV